MCAWNAAHSYRELAAAVIANCYQPTTGTREWYTSVTPTLKNIHSLTHCTTYDGFMCTSFTTHPRTALLDEYASTGVHLKAILFSCSMQSLGVSGMVARPAPTQSRKRAGFWALCPLVTNAFTGHKALLSCYYCLHTQAWLLTGAGSTLRWSTAPPLDSAALYSLFLLKYISLMTLQGVHLRTYMIIMAWTACFHGQRVRAAVPVLWQAPPCCASRAVGALATPHYTMPSTQLHIQDTDTHTTLRQRDTQTQRYTPGRRCCV